MNEIGNGKGNDEETSTLILPSTSDTTSATTPIPSTDRSTNKNENKSKNTTSFTPINYNPKVHSSVLWLVFTTEFFAFSLTSLLVPFFPNYAEANFDASQAVIGYVFAINPLVALLFTPITGYLCNRFGRKSIYFVGLGLLATGCIVFGFSKDIIQIFLGGVIIGMGSTCLGISGLALILQVSNNLERDAGWEEIICGLGYVLLSVLSIPSILFYSLLFLFHSRFAFLHKYSIYHHLFFLHLSLHLCI